MAKLILENENGTKIIRNNLPEDFSAEDLLFKKDYFATKLWMEEDVKVRLRELGFDDSKDQVEAVLSMSDILDGLMDCTDEEWNTIDKAILSAPLKEFSAPLETVYISHYVETKGTYYFATRSFSVLEKEGGKILKLKQEFQVDGLFIMLPALVVGQETVITVNEKDLHLFVSKDAKEGEGWVKEKIHERQ